LPDAPGGGAVRQDPISGIKVTGSKISGIKVTGSKISGIKVTGGAISGIKVASLHRKADNRLILPDECPSGHRGGVLRRERLGGMLNYYYRCAARNPGRSQ
jgi:hypothetical protein